MVPKSIVETLGAPYHRLPVLRDAAGNQRMGEGADGAFEIKVCRGKVRWHGRTVCDEFWVANTSKVLLGRADFFTLYDVFFDWSADPPYMDIEAAGTSRAAGAQPPSDSN